MVDNNTLTIASVISIISHKYPIIGMVIALGLGSIGTFFPNLLSILEGIEIPKLFMQLGQWFFWLLGSAVSVIVALPAIKKNFIDKIKNNKKKK